MAVEPSVSATANKKFWLWKLQCPPQPKKELAVEPLVSATATFWLWNLYGPDEEYDENEPSIWDRQRIPPPTRRVSSSSDEVICLDSD